MTRKELDTQRLFQEARHESLQWLTRRHFLKDSITGLGAMALGSFLGGCFLEKQNRSYICIWQGPHLNLSCSTINLT